MRIIEDSPGRVVVLCHQTIWIAVLPGLAALLIGAISISQRHWSHLWAVAGFAAVAWFFIRRDWLEIHKISRHVTCYSLKPFGLGTTDFRFGDVRDFIFEERGSYFRPALATSSGSFPLTAWYSAGSPRGYEHLRVRILVALDKLRPGLL
jgi:hypothetical protein